ncbi:MAG: peptidoglycan-binding domain-containing protein [Rhodanobacter sp.]
MVTPSVQFSENTGGGGAGALGIFGGAGLIAGALLSSMKTSEAATTLMLVDVRSGVQVAIAEGTAKNTDFGFGALGVGAGGGAGIGAYSKTPAGKVIAGAFLDSYNQMVRAVRAYTPQTVAGGLGTGGSGGLAVDGASGPAAAGGAGSGSNYSLVDAQRKLADMGLYKGKIDGLGGPGTTSAITSFQKIRGLKVSGQLDEATIGALR